MAALLCTLAVAAEGAPLGAWPLPPPRPHEPPFLETEPETAPKPKDARLDESAAPTPTPEASAAATASACLSRLRAKAILAEAAPPPPAPLPDCSVSAPVTIRAIGLASGERIELPSHPLLDCAFAETFSDFVRDLVAPLGAATLGSPVSAIDTGPGYECRPRNHVPGAKTSAHGQGIAIDLMGLTLADKRRVAVERQDGPREAVFVLTFRTAACGWFTTVLGPGADAAHATHLHLDTLRHGSSPTTRLCE